MRVLFKHAKEGSQNYLNGETAYYGAPERYYQSALVKKVNLQIVRAPEGAKQLMTTDDEILHALNRIPFGKIGSYGSTDLDLPENGILGEVLIPVSDMAQANELADTMSVPNQIREVLNNNNYFELNGKSVNYSTVKDYLDRYRLSNKDIRDKWLQSVKNLQRLNLTNDEIIDKKKSVYEDYVSQSEYTAVITMTTQHIVNNPEFKGYIVENFTDNYDAVNYRKNAVRKASTLEKVAVLAVPLTSKAVLNTILEISNKYVSDGSVPAINGKNQYNYHAIINDSTRIDGGLVDLKSHREHDKKLSA